MSLLRRTNGLYPSMMENFFDETWGRPALMKSQNATVPAVNIIENEDNFEIQVAAPGMDEKDLAVHIDSDTLLISVEKKIINEDASRDKKYARREFNYTSFKRAFKLPETVDDQKIEADYHNGILTLSIPKKDEARPKPPHQIKLSKKETKENFLDD